MFEAADFETLFSEFRQQKVLIIGDVMIDTYLWGNVGRVSPEAPVPIVSGVIEENRLGGAANVALNVKAMGAVPILCSVIGDDFRGKLFLDLMEDVFDQVLDTDDHNAGEHTDHRGRPDQHQPVLHGSTSCLASSFLLAGASHSTINKTAKPPAIPAIQLIEL